MATVRVYVCTYKRDKLLPRALKSLLSQTFEDWVCELHNDDPSNEFPRLLAERLGDPRITVVDHEQNLGITATFNLVFQDVAEPFVSLLEDDNWWEPRFLEEMVRVMSTHQTVHVAWANMRVWEEREDGSWYDTEKDLWDRHKGAAQDIEFHYFPVLSRIGEPRHSNGAMLVRTQRARDYVIPESTPAVAMEAVRERSFPHPMLFVPTRLANFAMTRSSVRSRDESVGAYAQLLLVGSFLKKVPLDKGSLEILWSRARQAATRSTNDLLLAAILFRGARYGLRGATLGDAIRLLLSVIRHPSRLRRTLSRLRSARELSEFLDRWTAERTREALGYGLASFSPSTGLPLFRKPGLMENDRAQQLIF